MRECLTINMYYKLKLVLNYDGTTQGNTDRDAFKAICDSEVASDYVYPNVILADSRIFHSYCILANNKITAELYYDSLNLGLDTRNNFYNSALTEKNKTTVLYATISKSSFFVESFDDQIEDYENKALPF